MPRISLVAVSAADIWTYATRTLTTTQFPFWSSIISPTYSSATVGAGVTGSINILPPTGETWLVHLQAYLAGTASGSRLYIKTRAGGVFVLATPERRIDSITGGPVFNLLADSRGLLIIDNTNYAIATCFNADTVDKTLHVRYSGFRLSESSDWRELISKLPALPASRELTSPLPAELAALAPHGCEMEEAGEYKQAILLEENTPIARDKRTGEIVESFTAYILVGEFLKRLARIQADPARAGFKRYFDRWAEEGISL